MMRDLGGFGAVSWCQWPWVSAPLNPLDLRLGQYVSSELLRRFLKLEGTVVTIDLTDYAIMPVDRILGVLMWMAENG
jgi:hypothetical protein